MSNIENIIVMWIAHDLLSFICVLSCFYSYNKRGFYLENNTQITFINLCE